ncbi:MAG TPA: sulfatase-like hydrolase/transferase, partial [Lacibacter sp.]|nr:sulfatase-like hydrolase/transferase [Lacibacter sp.]
VYVVKKMLRINGQTAELLAITAFFPLLFFGLLQDTLKAGRLPAFFTSYTFVLPGVLVVTAAALHLIYRKRPDRLAAYFATLLLVLCAGEVIQLVLKSRRPATDWLLDSRFTAVQEFNHRAAGPGNRPDIYFLLFDSYASSLSLEQTLGYNNSAIESFLDEQGFRTFREATSNYNTTMLSMSSLLNMDYLPDTASITRNYTDAFYRGNRSLDDNSLFRLLQQQDYRVVTAHPLSLNGAGTKYPTYFSYMKVQHYLYQTLPGRLYRDLGFHLKHSRPFRPLYRMLQQQQNQRLTAYLQESVSAVKATASRDTAQAPRFVYGHFTLPHEPYVFHTDGTLRVPDSILSGTNGFRNYLQQLEYANQLIRELVTHIRTNNRPNTCIILAGDHGYRSHSDANMPEHIFRILLSVYTPDGDVQNWPLTLSNANLFRLLLNSQWKARFGLLPDETHLVRARR